MNLSIMDTLTQILPQKRAEKYLKKYSWLTSFEVKKWLDFLRGKSRGKKGFSPENFRVHINRLSLFLKENKMSPQELIDEVENDDLLPKRKRANPGGMRILNFYNTLKDRGFSDKYSSAVCNTIKGFYKHNSFPIEIYIKTGELKNPKIALDKEMIKQALTITPHLRDKVIILIMASSGMSISDVLDLKFRDIYPEMNILKKKNLKKSISIDFRRVKNNRHYISFFSTECVEFLKMYLNEQKINMQENLDKNIFQISYRTFLPVLNRISKKLVGDYRINTKAFRRFFSTTMKMAGIHGDIVDFWMGHKIDSTKEAYLDPDKTRPLYEEKEDYVTILTTIVKMKAGEIKAEIKEEFLQSIETRDKSIEKLRERLEEKDRQIEELLKGIEFIKDHLNIVT